MSILNFTVEEINLIAIYLGETRELTVTHIKDGLQYMDKEIREIGVSAVKKLAALTEPDYSELTFSQSDETDG